MIFFIQCNLFLGENFEYFVQCNLSFSIQSLNISFNPIFFYSIQSFLFNLLGRERRDRVARCSPPRCLTVLRSKQQQTWRTNQYTRGLLSFLVKQTNSFLPTTITPQLPVPHLLQILLLLQEICLLKASTKALSIA